jgi:hypothetical protein
MFISLFLYFKTIIKRYPIPFITILFATYLPNHGSWSIKYYYNQHKCITATDSCNKTVATNGNFEPIS